MIRAEHLFFSYKGGPPYVIQDLNFHAEAGSYVSILGGNGTGKSTLVRLLLGLLKPIQGRVTTGTNRRAFVPQANDLADARFPLTVKEMLEGYRRLLKIGDRTQTEAVLDLVGLRDAKGQLLGSLSGGQRQKAFLARALLGNPELLVLDEPSAGVDPQSRKEIYVFLKELHTVRGVTVLCVEHNLEAAVENSSTLFHMVGGRGHFCDPASYATEYLTLPGVVQL